MAGVSNGVDGRPGDRIVRAVEARAPGIGAASLTALGAGDFCVAWVTESGWVVRVPRHTEAAASLAREALLLEALAGRLPLPIPRPTFYESVAADGVSFSVHRRVEGLELDRRLWQDLPDSLRADLPARLGGFLRALHEVEPEVGIGAGLREVDHASLMCAWARRTAPDGRLPLAPDLLRDLHTVLGEWVADEAGLRYAPAILHADISPGHVLFDPDRHAITGIIDWGDAVIGDPARDLIFLYEDWGGDFLDMALGGYSGDRSGRDRLRSRALVHYLVDQLDWTVHAAEDGRSADVHHGAEALARGVWDLRTSRR